MDDTQQQNIIERFIVFLFPRLGKPNSSAATQAENNNFVSDFARPDEEKDAGPPSPFDDLSLHFENSKLVPIALKKLFDDLAKQFRTLGEMKGRIGHNDMKSVEALADSEAKLFWERVKAEIGGKLDAYTLDAGFKLNSYNRMKDNYTLQKKYFDSFLNERRSNPHSFSIPMACFYSLIAAVLLFADCVLALNLMSIAFDFQSNTAAELQLDAIGREAFAPIFLNNWQVIVTSVGIALLSVYIKIFYDEYVGSTDGNEQLKIKYIIDILSYKEMKWVDSVPSAEGASEQNLHHTDLTQYNSDEMELIEKKLEEEQKFKFKVRLFILGCTIFLLSVLAYLRYCAEITIANRENVDSVFTRHPITGVAVFMLTLLFPVVSGICLSLSLKVLENIRGYEESEKGLKNAGEKLEKAFDEYKKIEQIRLHADKTVKTWLVAGNFFEITKANMISHYEIGYSLDFVKPDRFDPSTDVIKRMEQFRNKLTMHNNFAHLNSKSK